MKSLRPEKSTIEAVASAISFFSYPMASPPSMMFFSPLKFGSRAAPTPSMVALPSVKTAPLVAGNNPAIARMSDDLPEPLDPTIPKVSPS